MGRKYSNKINKKTLMQGMGVFIVSAVITVMFFQNCSQVSVSDLTLADKQEQARILRVGAGEVVVEVGASQFEKTEKDFTVGLSEVPNLKQFWIVDNSGTMELNNLNLSNSFGAMFDPANQESLYKFDTTAYLFSTAQTIPSLKGPAADQAVIAGIADLQFPFFALNYTTTQSFYDAQMRTLENKNTGLLPGDNVGFSIKRTAATDYNIQIAPVLTKKVSGANVVLTKEISKPAKTNTTAFEAEFKSKLGILQSNRVPRAIGSDGNSHLQSETVIDKESGLCAIARILDEPNQMYSSSDLLTFTVVTDENENDLSGKNCLKRTSYQKHTTELVNGHCWEFETPIKYSVTTNNPNPSYCDVTGKAGYEATFDYKTYSAGIQYRYLKTVGGINTYKTPQTKIYYTTPKAQITKQNQTPITYHLKQYVNPTYKFRQRTTKVSYYTKTCVTTILDGIPDKKCTVDPGLKFSYPVGDHYVAGNTCKTTGFSGLPANAIKDQTDGIAAQYLPACAVAAFPATYVSTSCGAVSADCDVQVDVAGHNIAVVQPIKYVAGDVRTSCTSTIQSLVTGVIVAAEGTKITSSHFPSCGAPAYNVATCVPGSDANCSYFSNGTSTSDVTKKGAYSGSGSGPAQCGQFVPSGSTFSSCAATTEDSGSGVCPTADVQYGCITSTSVEAFDLTGSVTVDGIRDLADCKNWITNKVDSNKRVDINNPAHYVCSINAPETKYIKSSLAFGLTFDGGTTIAVGQSCGSSSAAFHSAITSGKNLVAQETCKISMIKDGNTAQRPFGGVSCSAQLNADCSSLSYRNCGSTQSGGGSTPSTTAPVLIGNFPLSIPAGTACAMRCDHLIGSCDPAAVTAGLTVEAWVKAKYAQTNKTINCISDAPKAKTLVEALPGQIYANRANVCRPSNDLIPRYFVPSGPSYFAETWVDQFVTGEAGANGLPKKDLITYIKYKIEFDNLDVNFSVFIRKSTETVPTQAGIDYKGVHYENLATATGGQVYSVMATSYADALTNLSAEIRDRLIRKFPIPGMQPYQVVTDVTIVRVNGSTVILPIGGGADSWTQAGDSITIGNAITLTEGDRIMVKFQNNDGYVKAQLKKIFILDEMRPDQIVISVEHIKASGETVLLRTDEWLKSDNSVSIAPSVVINGGDQFRIKFKNNTDEE